MERYGAITAVTFGSTALGLPMSVRLARSARPLPAGNDRDAFDTSVELDRPTITAEVRLRDTAAAEALCLGQADILSILAAPTRSGQAGRTLSLNSAVLTGMEILYEQGAPAAAMLTFVAEAADGDADPFTAQESPQ